MVAEESTSEGRDKHTTTEDEEAKVVSDTDAQSSDPVVESMSSAQEKSAVDDWLKAVPGESPIRCIRECLERSFTVSSIRPFCQDYFYSVHIRISQGDGLDEIITKLIDYCHQQGDEEKFWQIIQRERSTHYNTYYPKWKKAIDHARKIGRLNTAEYSFKPDSRSESNEQSGNSPLDKNSGELTRWFFRELRGNERSLLLTAALFEGMSRQKMLQIANQLEEVFSE